MDNSEKEITIQDLYPELSPEEQEEAAERLREYIRIVWRIFEHLDQEGRLKKVLAEARKLRRESRRRK